MSSEVTTVYRRTTMLPEFTHLWEVISSEYIDALHENIYTTLNYDVTVLAKKLSEWNFYHINGIQRE